MRKITQQAVAAFQEGRDFSKSNTQVQVSGESVFMYLHGNNIAHKDAKGNLEITNCGWFSNTTKERLNGLPGVNIYQKDFEWYLNGEKWDGEWTKI